jgi:hypothetical protein
MRIKVTEQNVKSFIELWSNGENLTDELIFINGSIDTNECVNFAWNTFNIIIKIQSDSDNSNFYKLTFSEKL